MRASSSTRRDLLVILGCSVILILLVEFRYDVSSRVLIHIDNNYYASPPPTSSDGSLILDPGVELDEYGEPLKPKPVSPSSKHRSSHRHKGAAAKALAQTRPGTYDTRDRHIGESKIVWGPTGELPLTSLVRHSPGEHNLRASRFSRQSAFGQRWGNNGLGRWVPRLRTSTIGSSADPDREAPAVRCRCEAGQTPPGCWTRMLNASRRCSDICWQSSGGLWRLPHPSSRRSDRPRDLLLTFILAGFTILDNVYFLNGTLYLVQSSDATQATAFPEVRTMISNVDPEAESSLPTDEQMKIIDTAAARSTFGNQASRVAGTSVSLLHASPSDHANGRCLDSLLATVT